MTDNKKAKNDWKRPTVTASTLITAGILAFLIVAPLMMLIFEKMSDSLS